MTVSDARLYEALLRNDFLSFALRVVRELNPGRTFHQSWLHEAMSTYLGIVALERVHDRLIINVPPRSAKSTFATVALPAFLLGRDPTLRIITISYSNELSIMFGRQTRQVMQSAWYRALFPRPGFHPARRPTQSTRPAAAFGSRRQPAAPSPARAATSSSSMIR